jgi:hypothetical protein
LNRAAACFHTFVFGAYPALLVMGSNAGVLPIDGWPLARALAISFALTAALLLLLERPIPDLPTRAVYVSIVFIACSQYGILAASTTSVAAALLYVGASTLLALLVVRPWSRRTRSSVPWNVCAAVLLALNVYLAAPALRSNEPWRPAADALIDRVIHSAARPPDGPARDIYYVVLDGFGRPDVLKQLFDLDLDPFVEALEARGFTVPRASRSNYAQTYLSLGSSLNLSYLDEIAGAMRGSTDRRVLDHLIQHNALMTLARRAGYRVAVIGSDYSATTRIASADTCFCEQYGLTETELTILNLTPLRALPGDGWTYSAHRRKLAESFEHLERAADSDDRTLVFAHLLAPHPPFVFGADGGARSPDRRIFSFQDGSHYTGSRAEYVAGYRDQARFVAGRILAAVDAILARHGPRPVIVLHGDHGPGSMWHWDDLGAANLRERVAILSAYYLPGDAPADLQPELSPVNGLRIVANRYLGTALPALPDRTFVSTWRRPYDLLAVGPTDRIVRETAVAGTPVR